MWKNAVTFFHWPWLSESYPCRPSAWSRCGPFLRKDSKQNQWSSWFRPKVVSACIWNNHRDHCQGHSVQTQAPHRENLPVKINEFCQKQSKGNQWPLHRNMIRTQDQDACNQFPGEKTSSMPFHQNSGWNKNLAPISSTPLSYALWSNGLLFSKSPSQISTIFVSFSWHTPQGFNPALVHQLGGNALSIHMGLDVVLEVARQQRQLQYEHHPHEWTPTGEEVLLALNCQRRACRIWLPEHIAGSFPKQ